MLRRLTTAKRHKLILEHWGLTEYTDGAILEKSGAVQISRIRAWTVFFTRTILCASLTGFVTVLGRPAEGAAVDREVQPASAGGGACAADDAHSDGPLQMQRLH